MTIDANVHEREPRAVNELVYKLTSADQELTRATLKLHNNFLRSRDELYKIVENVDGIGEENSQQIQDAAARAVKQLIEDVKNVHVARQACEKAEENLENFKRLCQWCAE